MPFSQVETLTPTAIGNINVVLFTNEDSSEKKIHGTIDVLDQNGKLLSHRVVPDLSEYLTQAQKDGLISFMDNLRSQAITELLP